MNSGNFNFELEADSCSETSLASEENAQAAVIRDELLQVWEMHCAREREYCTNAIASLSSSHLTIQTFIEEPLDVHDAHITSDTSTDTFTVVKFESPNPDVQHDTVISASITVELLYPPDSPVYESAAPLCCSVFKGDDPDDLPFVPFSDDLEFPAQDFMDLHGDLAWLDNLNDPDVKQVAVETARRLYNRISPSGIDTTNILPFNLCSTTSRWGLLWNTLQSDAIQWVHTSEPCILPYNKELPEVNDLKARLQSLQSRFCDKKSCLHSVCIDHEYKPKHLDIQDYHILTQYKDIELETSCGIDCYAHTRSPFPERHDSKWSIEQLNNLKTILSIAAGESVCDLAVICGRPCYEVQFHIQKILASIREKVDQRRRRRLPTRPNIGEPSFDGHLSEQFTPADPCDHLGPCNLLSACECDLARVHCERGCPCNRTCPRRWKGCRCGSEASANTRNLCAIGSPCPCRLANRECDPELCLSCCRHPKTKAQVSPDHCTNAPLQRSHFKKLRIGQSEFGWGAFLCEAAEKGDLICEYLGELIYEPTFNSRAVLANHRGRSYVFGLHKNLDVDGSYAGNESRFINHSPEPNCVVRACLVNGDQRIGVYSNMQLSPGTEVRINYGTKFF